MRRIRFSDIIMVTDLKDYVRISIKDEKTSLTTHLSLGTIEELLPKELFMRINRSCIVALDKIHLIDRNFCVYIGDNIIHVTNTYRDDFKVYLENHRGWVH